MDIPASVLLAIITTVKVLMRDGLDLTERYLIPSFNWIYLSASSNRTDTLFSNQTDSRIVDPQLTTVHIFNNEMGITAAEMLLSRVKNPSKPFQITHINTEPVFRHSTGRLK